MANLSIDSVLPLNDGIKIYVFGLGVYESQLNGETDGACLSAFKHGYRMIDTAAIYKNEEEVGTAIAKCGLSRDQLYISTKVWNSDHGYDATIAACQLSLKKLNLDYVDLYLMHSPKGGHTVDTWKAMIELKKRGLVKSIGVSNFNVHHIEKLLEAVPDIVPAVNQIEISPYLQRKELVRYCESKGIAVQAYSPLTRGKRLDDPKLVGMAQKYGKSPAQVLIRWSLQSGYICIPKSVKDERIRQNCEVFDFVISDEDMTSMSSWDENSATCWTVIDDPWIP